MALVTETWADFASILPPSEEAAYGEDYERRARAVLSLLFDADVPPTVEQPKIDYSTCPNCGQPATSERSPYCGDPCREVAGFIRSVRKVVREGSTQDNERLAALGQVLWHLLGGGYPGRRTLVPERARERLFKTTEGKCAICGKPATTFDHIATACNRPINLRPVCENCSTTREFGDADRIGAARNLLQDISARVRSDAPIRCCDDPDNWEWRAYVKSRNG